MRRRLDLAASLVGRPRVIFLDEPTTGLDPGKRDDVWTTIRRLTGLGTSVLLTTQYLEEAEALADAITVIDKGRVIAHGRPAELKQIVGTRTLQVRPADARHLPDVSALLACVTERPVEQPAIGLVAVPADDAQLTEVVAELSRRGIPVTELALKLPDLDEVFFTLTGRTRPAGAAADESAKELVR
jgi:oleandomycin transport system ATP-binding protein